MRSILLTLAALACAALAARAAEAGETAGDGGETLYNGIRLPEVWPPRGRKLTREPMPVTGYQDGQRSWLVSVILACAFFVTGIGGMHRFYTGHILSGFLQLITLGGCGVWQIIDVLLILTGSFRDEDGRPLYQ